MNYSIAIDGPAGAGKSTIAKGIAKQLGYIYVDTGAMYRAMGLHLLEHQIDNNDLDKMIEICKDVCITIEYVDGEQQVLLNERNVNSLIRTEEVSKMASYCGTIKEVRLKLVALQQELAKTRNVVMDGRDIGTYVLPEANLKIFLTASSAERARRRWQENKDKGIECNLPEIEQDIIARDLQDMNRDFAPLKQAEDAILIDSSYMSIPEVIEKVIKLFDGLRKE